MPENSAMRFVFTVDTDADAYFGNAAPAAGREDKSILGWDSLDQGREKLLDAVAQCRDSFGGSLRVTWFVRCDRQIAETYGDAAYLLHRYNDWWRERISFGDEIQWHAHLYRRTNGGAWQQEFDDEHLVEDIREGMSSFERWGLRPRVIRVGECFQTTFLVNYLREMGLRADSTALPGRCSKDREKNFDWMEAPNFPYHPSVDDYRKPSGKPGFWEIPMNTISTKASYDKAPLLRYFNPAFHSDVMTDGLKAFCTGHSVLVSVMHLFEIMSEFLRMNGSEHPLLSFASSAVSENLRLLKETVAANRGTLQYLTMTELLDSMDGSNV